ncbi:MAG: Gfo/Idh/MocA family oxidoreductase [Opitutaceae bacterium]|nr:Gfo/Idh/MocA family oxidoreductase [Opitutaceae bacterium]MBP9914094.1 Gfo/Idh/MocA family oxidoreductase [Opitutaceae bacterium]
MSIKLALVGVGQFAQYFIPLFKAHPLVRELMLCDLDATKLRAAAEKFGVTRTFPSLEAALNAEVDAVAIMTQHWLHAPQAVQALHAGKHVYSAVPVGLTLDEIRSVIRAVEATGRIYMMGETSYYYPHVIYCRELHRRGGFGHVTYTEASYYHDWDIVNTYAQIKARAGDRFLELAGSPPMHYPSHTISQVVSLLGAHMTKAACLGWKDRHADGIYDPRVNRDQNPYSNETALFAMSDGSVSRINEFRRVGHPGGELMSVYGTEAGFEYTQAGAVLIGKDFAQTTRLDEQLRINPGRHGGTALVQPVDRLPREFAALGNEHKGSHQFLVDDFVRACVSGEQPPVNVWAAARYLTPGLAAHESAMQGGVQVDVTDLGPPPCPA